MASSRLSTLLRENPIVITGIGAFSAGGETADQLWQTAVNGQSTATAFPLESGAPRSTFPAYRAPELDVSRDGLRRLKRLDRAVQMAWVAADEALRQAGLEEVYSPERVGVVVGTARGPVGNLYAAANGSDLRRSPSFVADNAFASLSGALARSFSFQGPSATVAATCASAVVAIASAAEQILLGKADAMLTGGAEAPLQRQAFEQFDAAGVLAMHDDPAQACRPFDRDRNGLVLGEGSAFLVLESEAAARERGAVPVARLAGWAYGTDVSSRTATEESRLSAVIEQALAMADLRPAEIDYVNLHGTGTQLGDFTEAEAMARVFGPRTPALPCSSTKPITGHCLGATPALEAVLCVKALREQLLPPSANCPNQDPCCRIALQTSSARTPRIRTVVSNSLGFWGQCAALVFSTVEAGTASADASTEVQA